MSALQFAERQLPGHEMSCSVDPCPCADNVGRCRSLEAGSSIDAPLRYEIQAGEPDGRLLDLHGTLLADGRVTMRATAQFASLDRSRFGRP